MRLMCARLSAMFAAAVVAGTSSFAHASFAYSFVFGPPSALQYAGDAQFSTDNNVQLTTGGGQAGAVWHEDRQLVSLGFVTTFRFRIETPAILGDGFAFVLQNDGQGAAALGAGGSGLGYHELTSSIAIEFDTFSFGPPNEFEAPHVSIQTRGADPNSSNDSASLAVGYPLFDFADGNTHTATIQYVPFDGTTASHIDVYIDSSYVVSADVDLTNVNGADITSEGAMFVGFTAGTGLADSTHIITDWAFDDTTGSCDAPHWTVMGWGGGGFGGAGGMNWLVAGSRPMEFHFFKYDTEVTDDNGGRIVGLGTDSITINDFQPADQGYYRLTAANHCGSASSLKVFLGVCVADIDDGSSTGTPDGGVTIDDLLYFLALFAAGDSRADMDDGSGNGFGDDGVTIDDLLFFLVHFANGC